MCKKGVALLRGGCFSADDIRASSERVDWAASVDKQRGRVLAKLMGFFVGVL